MEDQAIISALGYGRGLVLKVSPVAAPKTRHLGARDLCGIALPSRRRHAACTLARTRLHKMRERAKLLVTADERKHTPLDAKSGRSYACRGEGLAFGASLAFTFPAATDSLGSITSLSLIGSVRAWVEYRD